MDSNPDRILSWRQVAGLIAALGIFVAAFYAFSPHVAMCAAGLLLPPVSVGISILVKLQGQKEQFLADVDRSEGQ
jgi:hypothetical protein